MVRYSLLAVVAICLATPALAGPLGSGYGGREAIVITSDIPPEHGACVKGLPCWSKPKHVSGPRDKRRPPAASKLPHYKKFKDFCSSNRAGKGKYCSGSRSPYSPMGGRAYSVKGKTGDMRPYEADSNSASGYEYGKSPDSKENGYYWGDSDASTQKEFNCPGCHKDFDELSSQFEQEQDRECSDYAECDECPDCNWIAMEEEAGNGDANIAARSESQQTPLNSETPRKAAAVVNNPRFAAVCVVTELSQKCIAAGNAVCSPDGTLDAKDPRCARTCNCVRV